MRKEGQRMGRVPITGSSPVTGPRSTRPKVAGEAHALGPVQPFWITAALAGSEAHHSGTESSSGKLTSGPPSPNYAAWLSLLLGSGGPRSVGAGRGASEVIPSQSPD